MADDELWTVIILMVVLKLPLAWVLWAIWYGARLADRVGDVPPEYHRRLALCGYCGHRIVVGYDAGDVHRQATLIATSTGEAPFDVETRLIREELSQPGSYPIEPGRCPGCGETGAWVPIEPLDELTSRALAPARPGQA